MPEWRVTQTPKYARLNAAVTDGVAAFCVGERGLLAERVGPDDWWARCLNGPTGDRRDLLDVALSTRHERVWFCGDGGALGSYDRVTGAVRAHALPFDHATTLRHLAVRGRRGAESVFVADDRGRVLRLSVADGGLSTGGAAVPGDGTALTGLVRTPEALVAADLAGRLYWSERGRRWRSCRLTSTAVVDVAHAEETGVVAVDESGVLYRYTLPNGERRLEVAELGVDSPRAVAARGGRVVVAGGEPYYGPAARGAGEVAVVVGDSGVRSPALEEPLSGAGAFADGTVLAVGAAGVAVERRPP